MLSYSYHNSNYNSNPPNSATTDKYYSVIQFWQRLGLKTRKNKESEHLEHSLSFPNQDPIGRVFKAGDWIAIRFYSDFEKISPKLKGGEKQPDLSGLKIGWLYSALLAQFLKIPEAHILIKPDGFAIFNGQSAAKGGQN